MNNISGISWREQVIDDDDEEVRFVKDQHAYLDTSAS